MFLVLLSGGSVMKFEEYVSAYEFERRKLTRINPGVPKPFVLLTMGLKFIVTFTYTGADRIKKARMTP